MKHILLLLIVTALLYSCTGRQDTRSPQREEPRSESGSREIPVPEVTLEEQLEELVDALLAPLEKELITAVIEAPYREGTRFVTGGGLFLKESLISLEHPGVVILQGIPEQYKRSGTKILYYGEPSFYVIFIEYALDTPESLRVSASLYDRKKTRVQSSGSISIPLSLFPGDLAFTGTPIQSYPDLESGAAPYNYYDFGITVTGNIPQGGGIRHGDKVIFTITSQRDCYIKVYDISQTGKIIQLLPDLEWGPRENFIQAGKPFNPMGETHELVVHNPIPGKMEVIHIIAQTRQFDELRNWYNLTNWKELTALLEQGKEIPLERSEFMYYQKTAE